MAHVPQNIYLTDGSIAENIAFGIPRHEIDFERPGMQRSSPRSLGLLRAILKAIPPLLENEVFASAAVSDSELELLVLCTSKLT